MSWKAINTRSLSDDGDTVLDKQQVMWGDHSHTRPDGHQVLFDHGHARPYRHQVFDHGHTRLVKHQALFDHGHTRLDRHQVFDHGYTRPDRHQVLFDSGHTRPDRHQVLFDHGHTRPDRHQVLFDSGHTTPDRHQVFDHGHTRPDRHQVLFDSGHTRPDKQQVLSDHGHTGFWTPDKYQVPISGMTILCILQHIRCQNPVTKNGIFCLCKKQYRVSLLAWHAKIYNIHKSISTQTSFWIDSLFCHSIHVHVYCGTGISFINLFLPFQAVWYPYASTGNSCACYFRLEDVT